MSNLLRESLRREDDSRSLLRDLFRSDADVIPHSDSQVLEVRIHTLANPAPTEQSNICSINLTPPKVPIPEPSSGSATRSANHKMASLHIPPEIRSPDLEHYTVDRPRRSAAGY